MPINDFLKRFRHPSTPKVAASAAQALLADTACAASGAYAYVATVIDCSEAREVALLVDYVAGATGGYVAIAPVFSAAEAEPASGSDVWFHAGVTSGAVSEVLPAAKPAGADYDHQPEHGFVKYLPFVARTQATDDADEGRMEITLKCAWARFMQIKYAEVGVVATPGTLNLKYVLVT